DEEEPDRERERERDREPPDQAADRPLLPALLGLDLRVRGYRERPEPDLERLGQGDDAADDRPAERAVARGPGDQRLGRDLDRPVGLAAGHRPGGDAAHHHALEDGLAATGASRAATGSPSGMRAAAT